MKVSRQTPASAASPRTSDGARDGLDAPRGEAAFRPSETRVLGFLTRPMAMADIARGLGLSRQRVHQLVSRLTGLGALRLSDETGQGRLVARRDDPATLLSAEQARTLSALLPGGKASLRSIAAATGMGSPEAMAALRALAALDLATETTHGGEPGFWSVTEAGGAHPQFRAPARKATRVSSGIRSDRREAVLSLLLNHGPLRGVEISRRLGIERQTNNALMQYFRRKGWIAKTGGDLFSTYALTALGAEALETLDRRRYEDERMGI